MATILEQPPAPHPPKFYWPQRSLPLISREYEFLSVTAKEARQYAYHPPNVSVVDTPLEVTPFTPTDDGGVKFDESLMAVGRPYPYCLQGVWFVAVRHSEDDGDVEIYHFSREDRA